MIKVILIVLAGSFLLFSCRKQSNINCRADGAKIICESKQTKQVIVLKHKTIRLIKKINNEDTITWRFNKFGNLISKTFFSRNKDYTYIEYKKNKVIHAAQLKHDFFERISFFENNKNRYYTVQYGLPKLKTSKSVYYFAKNHLGKIFGDYYYYKLTDENTIEFVISDKKFDNRTPGLDSMFIDFTRKNFKSVPYVIVPPSDVFPNLEDFKSERVFLNEKISYSSKDSLYITGLFWSFVKSPDRYINYRDVIICGDLNERIKNFDSIVEHNHLSFISILKEMNLDFLEIQNNGQILVPNSSLMKKINKVEKKNSKRNRSSNS